MKEAQRLVLDGFLCATADTRRCFQLSAPKFGERQIRSYTGAAAAMDRIVADTLTHHGSEIYSKVHPLLAEDRVEMYADRVSLPGPYSRHRIHSAWVERALRRVLEVGLQTVVQLPCRDPKAGYSTKRVKALASALRKSAEQVDHLFLEEEAVFRITKHFGPSPGDKIRLFKVGAEMRWAAGALDAIARLKVRKIHADSPNPQVRFALYLGGWFEACTGKKHYEILKNLLAAAFYAAGKRPPKWVERPALEMYSKRRRRRSWIQSITDPA